jgi:hypothetical protein
MTEHNDETVVVFKHDILSEVYQRKAHVIEKFGGFDGFMKHLDENRPQLIAEGWQFINPEELQERNLKRLEEKGS